MWVCRFEDVKSGGAQTRVVAYHCHFLRIRCRRHSNVGIDAIVGEKWASWKGFTTAHVGPQGRSGQGGARPRRLSGRDTGLG